jgi:hypothetical protein
MAEAVAQGVVEGNYVMKGALSHSLRLKSAVSQMVADSSTYYEDGTGEGASGVVAQDMEDIGFLDGGALGVIADDLSDELGTLDDFDVGDFLSDAVATVGSIVKQVVPGSSAVGQLAQGNVAGAIQAVTSAVTNTPTASGAPPPPPPHPALVASLLTDLQSPKGVSILALGAVGLLVYLFFKK